MDSHTPVSTPSTPASAPPVVPAELRGWNWGAAGLTWIWGIRFNVWIAFLTFVPAIGGIWWIVLGIKGNEWAWRENHWTSVEEYKKAMAPWSTWGKVLFIVSLALPLLLMAWMMTFFTVSSVSTQVY